MVIKYTKWSLNIPIRCKLCIPNVKNIPTYSIAKPSKINLDWDFWFEKLPSGHPASQPERDKSGRREVDEKRMIIEELTLLSSLSIFLHSDLDYWLSGLK
jgi:hypothetical protein